MTFNVLHGNGPLYLRELRKPIQNNKPLSSSQIPSRNPYTKLKTTGDRAFTSAAGEFGMI